MSEKCPKCGAGFTRRPFSRKGWKYCDCGRRFHPVHGWETWENVTCLLRQLAQAQEKLASQQAIIDRLPLTFRQLQDGQRPWVIHNFPGWESIYPLLGAVEELGELRRAHLKALQGIRGTPEEHQAAKEDAVADAIIFIADYCTANGIDLQEAVETTWAKVKKGLAGKQTDRSRRRGGQEAKCTCWLGTGATSGSSAERENCAVHGLMAKAARKQNVQTIADATEAEWKEHGNG